MAGPAQLNVDLSCKDWADRLRNGKSIIPALPLNEAEGRRGMAIFNRLRLPDVVGTPTFAEAGGDWFREIVVTLFGAITDEAVRFVREVLLLVPKKNSKTTNGAGLMLTALLMNNRPRAEFLLIGPTQDIAKLAFSQVIGMIEADEEGMLQKRMQIREHTREIFDRKRRASLAIKSFDSSVVTGVKPAGVLVDEVHEIAKSPYASRVIGQLRGGMMANPEAFLVFITTQSDEPPRGAFKDELTKARAIRDGRAKGSMLPVLYEFPDDIARAGTAGQDAPWYDSSLWWMVTPNRGRSVRIERLIEEFETAKAVGIEEIARWASQHLNIEMGVGLRTDRWRGADHWLAAVEPTLTLESLLAVSEVVCMGVDGGGLDDLLGFAVLGRERGTRRWLLWCRAWCYRGVISLRKNEASRLLDLEKTGDLVIVDDLEDAFRELADIAADVAERGLLDKVGIDPMGVGQIVDALAERGIEGAQRVVGVAQGYQLNGAIKTAETKVASRSLVHGGQALMAWCVGNAKIELKGNAVVVTKAVSGVGKIDPLMAAFNAVQLMSRNPEGQGESVWEEIGRRRRAEREASERERLIHETA